MEIRKSRIEGFLEISCDKAHIIRRKGSGDTTENRMTTVPSGTESEWEEVVLADVLAEKERQEQKEAYENDVEARIRARYSVSQELAILRQRDSKPEEFAEYNAFAEECKAEAKKACFAEVWIKACDNVTEDMLTGGGADK